MAFSPFTVNTCLGFAILLGRVLASPLSDPEASHGADLHRRAGLNIIKTTVTPSGQILDWIPLESQGNIIHPPPLPADVEPFVGTGAFSELLLPGVDLGPAGTVPIARMSQAYMASRAGKKLPPTSKALLPRDVEEEDGLEERDLEKRQDYKNTHWYVSATQQVDPSYGSQASYSMFKAATQNPGDFSLLQTALVRTNAQRPGSPSQTVMQSIEAGWINYPLQISQPHIFTLYTVNGYESLGNNIGGWNTEVSGWVQWSKTYYPGLVMTPLSTIGGAQNEINLRWFLAYGAWFLMISGPNIQPEYMGYYPASLFSNNTQSSGPPTLGNSSNLVYFYGEIYQNETTVTTTDMGSGKYGYTGTGYGQAGYIHNMTYLDVGGTSYPFTADWWASNASLWNWGFAAPGAPNWGKYVYLGGPGAGGVIGSPPASGSQKALAELTAAERVQRR